MSTRHRAAIVRAQDEKAYTSSNGPPPASVTGQKQWFALPSSMRRKLDEIAYTIVQDLAMYDLATADLRELEAEWVITPTNVRFDMDERRNIATALGAIGSMCETLQHIKLVLYLVRRRTSSSFTGWDETVDTMHGLTARFLIRGAEYNRCRTVMMRHQKIQNDYTHVAPVGLESYTEMLTTVNTLLEYMRDPSDFHHHCRGPTEKPSEDQ